MRELNNFRNGEINFIDLLNTSQLSQSCDEMFLKEIKIEILRFRHTF